MPAFNAQDDLPPGGDDEMEKMEEKYTHICSAFPSLNTSLLRNPLGSLPYAG
jgi:hypothetical protein